MKGRKETCDKAFYAFKRKHPTLFKQPIIQSFLRNEAHQELVRQAICFPTKQNMRFVDEAFQTFYGNVKALTYLSNVVYYNAINFDKSRRRHVNREMLTLDQPLREGSEETQKDMLYNPSRDMVDQIAHETMDDYVENPQLYQAIQILPPKQQKILTYKYVYSLKSKEIADLFGDSPQNISKMHRKALEELKKHLQKGRNHHGNTGRDNQTATS